MTGSGIASVADFLFRVGGFDAERLRVTGFTGVEGISELYDFRIELSAREAVPDSPAVLLQPCELELRHESGVRAVRGIVRSFEQTGHGQSLTRYAARVVPVHWLLTQRFRSRIFQEHNCRDMSVPGIIAHVLRAFGIADGFQRFALERTHPPREYVVQYRETDMDFISRLMEDEGLCYYFETIDEQPGYRMVIGDGPVAHRTHPQAGLYPYRDRNGLAADREFVHAAQLRHEITTGAVELDDFDFRRPAAPLEVAVEADRFQALATSDYPGEYTHKPTGQRYARTRLEESAARRRVLEFVATARGLTPGFRFELYDHPSEDIAGHWLVTRVEHRCVQPTSDEEERDGAGGVEYQAAARAIPAEVVFRAPRVTPRPFVHGSQTAIVVGPRPEEIHTDHYGRVKVRFHWDPASEQETPDEQRSCWIRVSQGWAGGQYGMLFLPRVGHEVIVDFLEGNPDRPIITGRVYNNDNMPPCQLPQEKTRSTIKTHTSPDQRRFHELRFEDAYRREQLFIRAQRRMDTRVVGPHFHTTAGSLHELNGGITRDGPKGGYFRTAFENADLRVEAGAQYELIQKLRNVIVADDATDAYRRSYALFIQQKLEAIAEKRIVMTSDEEILFYVGNNFIRITRNGIQIQGKMVLLNDDKALRLDGIASRDIDQPLKALPADDGLPGRGRGGRAAPRQREKLHLEGRKGPEVIPPRPPVPPPAANALTIRARCEHAHNGPRQIIQRQTLHVVPTPDHGLKDMIVLEAESRPPAPTPPHWTISGIGEKDGPTATFPATPPNRPTTRHNWYWNPVAGTKTRYHVTCRDGHNRSEWLQVHAYPEVRRLCLRDQTLLNTLLAAVRKISSTLDVIPGLDFEFGDKVDVEGRAGWKEDADPGVSFVYDFAIKAPQIAKVNFGPHEVSLRRIARKVLPGWLTRVLPSIVGVVEIKGEIGCDARISGTYRPDRPQKWQYTTQGGMTGKIDVRIGVKASTPGDVVTASGTLVGSFSVQGAPVAGDSGLGLGIGISFSGVEGEVELELPLLPDPSGNVTIWDADRHLFGPTTIPVPLGECGGSPPDIPDIPDPDIPVPDFPSPIRPFPPRPDPQPDPPGDLPHSPDRCPSGCHERHPNMKPPPPPQPPPQPRLA